MPPSDVTALVRGLDPAVILRAAALCDGHGILAPEAFTAVGLPQAVVAQLTVAHRSDPAHPKATIFRDGQAVASVTGVCGLQMLTFLAGCLGVEYRHCLGRGFQAEAIRDALHRRFEDAAGGTGADRPRHR